MTLYIFIGFIVFLALQRLLELRISKRHEEALVAQGGKEHAPEHFIIMKIIHISWLVASIVEVYIYNREFNLYIFLPAFVLMLIGQSLRYAAMSALKDRWTVRIMTIPNRGPVTSGIFRYIRHPNYLGVILEIAAVPLLHSAYLTSVFASLANALLLMKRIHEEEKALSQENNYKHYFKKA
jgi:methyltransferase